MNDELLLPRSAFLSTFVSGAIAVAVTLAAPAAFADIPAPSNDCFSAAQGSACSNAGPDQDQDGVCMPGRCKEGSDTPTDASIACMECVVVSPACPDGGCPASDAGIPKNACAIEDLGQSCSNAGPNLDQAGVCATGPCDDGETCSYCQVPDGGVPTKDAGAKDATTTKDASTHSSSSSSSSSAASSLQSSSGCSIGASGGSPFDGAWLFALGGVGYVGSAMSRRRRAR